MKKTLTILALILITMTGCQKIDVSHDKSVDETLLGTWTEVIEWSLVHGDHVPAHEPSVSYELTNEFYPNQKDFPGSHILIPSKNGVQQDYTAWELKEKGTLIFGFKDVYIRYGNRLRFYKVNEKGGKTYQYSLIHK